MSDRWPRLTPAEHRQVSVDAGHDGSYYTLADLGRVLAERRRSNAAGAHGDRRTRRNRDRAAQRRTAIKDQEA